MALKLNENETPRLTGSYEQLMLRAATLEMTKIARSRLGRYIENIVQDPAAQKDLKNFTRTAGQAQNLTLIPGDAARNIKRAAAANTPNTAPMRQELRQSALVALKAPPVQNAVAIPTNPVFGQTPSNQKSPFMFRGGQPQIGGKNIFISRHPEIAASYATASNGPVNVFARSRLGLTGETRHLQQVGAQRNQSIVGDSSTRGTYEDVVRIPKDGKSFLGSVAPITQARIGSGHYFIGAGNQTVNRALTLSSPNVLTGTAAPDRAEILGSFRNSVRLIDRYQIPSTVDTHYKFNQQAAAPSDKQTYPWDSVRASADQAKRATPKPNNAPATTPSAVPIPAPTPFQVRRNVAPAIGRTGGGLNPIGQSGVAPLDTYNNFAKFSPTSAAMNTLLQPGKLGAGTLPTPGMNQFQQHAKLTQDVPKKQWSGQQSFNPAADARPSFRSPQYSAWKAGATARPPTQTVPTPTPAAPPTISPIPAPFGK